MRRKISEENIMKVSFYIGIATRGGECFVIGSSTNRRLLDIQRDAYMMGHIEWNVKIHTIIIDIEPDGTPRVILLDEQQAETGMATETLILENKITGEKMEFDIPPKLPVDELVKDVDDILGNKE
jgi:hypothetical protein